MSHQDRIPAGVPTGGRFAAATHAEAGVALVAPPLDPAALGLPTWAAPAGTDDPVGAFSRCKEVSAEYTSFLREHGIDAEWVQTCGPRGHFPDAQPQWRGLEQTFWQHYLTRVPGPGGPYYVDFTARQFDPDAAHPQVTPVRERDWEETRVIDDAARDRFLDQWRRAIAAHR